MKKFSKYFAIFYIALFFFFMPAIFSNFESNFGLTWLLKSSNLTGLAALEFGANLIYFYYFVVVVAIILFSIDLFRKPRSIIVVIALIYALISLPFFFLL